MDRPLAEVRRWMQEGTALILDAVSALDEAALEEPSALPGWNRKRLLAHIAANSDALQNLTHWAATGEETPMYASPEARAEGIERSSKLSVTQLKTWVAASAARLEADMAVLTDEQWETNVVTAQGRTVPATETPWMRDREVFVHAVDLSTGITFADLPEDFLEALRTDIVTKRGESPPVEGTLADVVAYLAGRPYNNVTLNGASPPDLGPWL